MMHVIILVRSNLATKDGPVVRRVRSALTSVPAATKASLGVEGYSEVQIVGPVPAQHPL